MASSSIGDAPAVAAGDIVMDNIMQWTSDPKFTKPPKYDKEAWRGDEDQDQDDQYFAKPINLEV